MTIFLGTADADILNGTVDNDVLLGSGGDDIIDGGEGSDRLSANEFVQFYGLTSDNTLVSFSANDPSTTTLIPVTGLDGDLLGIDVRPANGLIYGITDNNSIYTIDPVNFLETAGSINGSFTLTNDEESQLLSDALYVNLHTENFNGGELRGQLDIDLENDIVEIGLVMEESQEVGTVPPNTSATGSFDVVYDDATNQLDITGTFSDLTSPLFSVGTVDAEGNPQSAIHLHNAAAGSGGPIVRNFTITSDSTFEGSFTLTDAEEAELLTDNLYINLHTDNFNGGELRGQLDITIEDDVVARGIALEESQEVGTVPPDTEATGTVNIVYDDDTNSLVVDGSFRDLTSALFPVGDPDSESNPQSAVHIHNAAAGSNGPIVRNLTTASANATFVSTLDQPFLSDRVTGFDFNPAADRLRLVGANDQDFRINVDTGAVTVDGTLAYDGADTNVGADPVITAAAYTNAFDGTSETQLYDIDAALDVLVLQNPPNDGVLMTVGSLGVDFGNLGGFDILSFDNGSNTAYAVSNSTLYQIDLSTGTASSLGTIGDGSLVFQGLTSQVSASTLGGNAILNGGLGDDVILGGLGVDTIDGGDGNDLIRGAGGNDPIKGGNDNDSIDGGSESDTINGERGNDLINGGSSNDTLRGNAGDDVIEGEGGRDRIRGGGGSDLLLGGRGRDTVVGGGGNDTLKGDANLEFAILTDTNALITFNPTTPGDNQRVEITGVDGTLLGIDVRPANGLIYGISDTDNIYTIDSTTGEASLVSTLDQSFDATTVSGFDFNPAADRLRLVGDNDQDFRINVETGEVTVDGTLTYDGGDVNAGADPNITAAAYTNSFDGTDATQLYDIDAELNTLVLQDPPNDGVLGTIGELGIDFDTTGGLDILASPTGLNMAFAVSDSILYTVDLATGATSSLGQISGVSDNIVGLTANMFTRGTSGDTLRGGGGDDYLEGEGGRDRLIGGRGDDMLTGGIGGDFLVGKGGSDRFMFTSDEAFDDARLGTDRIRDFTSGTDLIVLSQTTFGDIDTDQIEIVATNQEAASSSGIITYSTASGNLYFNENGSSNGFGDGKRFARLLGAPEITVNDFEIVA